MISKDWLVLLALVAQIFLAIIAFKRPSLNDRQQVMMAGYCSGDFSMYQQFNLDRTYYNPLTLNDSVCLLNDIFWIKNQTPDHANYIRYSINTKKETDLNHEALEAFH